MAQSSSFFITEQYGDSAPITVSDCLTAEGAQAQLMSLSKGHDYLGGLLPKECRWAVAEADGFDGRPYSFHFQYCTLTVHRHKPVEA